MKELLEAGVHFGHQVKRWNPKMKEYIFGERNGIYIIDLQKTARLFKDAVRFVTTQAAEGKTIMFVGTKRQAQEAIADEAQKCNQFFVNQRWLGGLLTNFQTIQKSIKRLKEIEAMQADGRAELLTKKERIGLDRERLSLEKNLSGIKNMTRLPDMIFIIDSKKEEIAIKEANRLGIPVIAVVDTNCDPDGVDYVIPGNDDALRAVRLFASKISESMMEGQQMLQTKKEEDAAEAAAAKAAAGEQEEARRERRRARRAEVAPAAETATAAPAPDASANGGAQAAAPAETSEAPASGDAGSESTAAAPKE